VVFDVDTALQFFSNVLAGIVSAVLNAIFGGLASLFSGLSVF